MLKPPKQKQYTYPDVPFPLFETNRSGVILGSSGNGKSSMLISLLLGPYRGKHSRVWVCSPSARPGIDSLWDLWRSYVQEHTDWGDEESIFYDLSPETLETLTGLVETHGKVNALLKKRGKRKMHTACLIIDDLADTPELHSSTNLISRIFLSGRHLGVQCICLSQRWRALSTAVRSQACWLCMFRLRNKKETDAVFEELSAIYPVKTLQAMYEEATAERFGFMYVNMLAPTKRDMFFKGFDYRMTP